MKNTGSVSVSLITIYGQTKNISGKSSSDCSEGSRLENIENRVNKVNIKKNIINPT